MIEQLVKKFDRFLRGKNERDLIKALRVNYVCVEKQDFCKSFKDVQTRTLQRVLDICLESKNVNVENKKLLEILYSFCAF